jgi:hypothetical protein
VGRGESYRWIGFRWFAQEVGFRLNASRAARVSIENEAEGCFLKAAQDGEGRRPVNPGSITLSRHDCCRFSPYRLELRWR